MSTTGFDPRRAALRYAAEAERIEAAGGEPVETAAAVNAVTCGLVYVGDQIARLADIVADSR